MRIHAALDCHKPRQLHYPCQKVRGLYSSYCERPLNGGGNNLLQQRAELYYWETRSVWKGLWTQPISTSGSWLTPTSACWNTTTFFPEVDLCFRFKPTRLTVCRQNPCPSPIQKCKEHFNCISSEWPVSSPCIFCFFLFNFLLISTHQSVIG